MKGGKRKRKRSDAEQDSTSLFTKKMDRDKRGVLKDNKGHKDGQG